MKGVRKECNSMYSSAYAFYQQVIEGENMPSTTQLMLVSKVSAQKRNPTGGACQVNNPASMPHRDSSAVRPVRR